MKLNPLQKTLRSAIVLTAVSFSLGAFAQNIAIVNGKAVPKSRAEALTQQIIRSGRPVTPEVEDQIKEEVIAREIFMQEAQKVGLDGSSDFKEQMELARATSAAAREANELAAEANSIARAASASAERSARAAITNNRIALAALITATIAIVVSIAGMVHTAPHDDAPKSQAAAKAH